MLRSIFPFLVAVPLFLASSARATTVQINSPNGPAVYVRPADVSVSGQSSQFFNLSEYQVELHVTVNTFDSTIGASGLTQYFGGVSVWGPLTWHTSDFQPAEYTLMAQLWHSDDGGMTYSALVAQGGQGSQTVR